MASFTPVQFGKYVLLDRIAMGGMAELYRAKIRGAKGFEKLIAVKKILPHLTAEESLIRAFIDEAKLAAFLQHPNIVQIYDFGKMNGSYFLAMEYLCGQDLRFVVRKSEQINEPISLGKALHIAARICDGIHHAHTLRDFQGSPLNIIHRDIGPHNIFITYDGQVKVIDFGIAKAATQNSTTQTGLIKGKVAYMSPEQAQGKEIDRRSDIYSIGIILYELVTRRPMFTGDTFQIYAKACKAEFEPPEKVNEKLPEMLYAILNKALAVDPQQRYQQADELAADLEKCILGIPSSHFSKSLSQYMLELFGEEAAREEQTMRESAAVDTSETEGPEAKTAAGPIEETLFLEPEGAGEKQKRRKPAPAAAAVFLIIAGAAAAFVFLNRLSEDRPVQLDRGYPAAAAITEVLNRNGPPELSIAKRLIEEKRYGEAAAALEAAQAREPAVTAGVSDLYAAALQAQALLLEESDRPRARALLLKAAAAAPQNARNHFLLGRICFRQKDYSRAVEAYRQAVALDPDMAEAFFNLGYIYYTVKKDYAGAREMYERTAALSPPFLDEALFNLALVQNKLGSRGRCIENLERAIRVNPENQRAKKLLAKVRTQ